MQMNLYIAHHMISLRCDHPVHGAFLQEYLVHDPIDAADMIDVSVTEDDVLAEKKMSGRMAPESYWESLALERATARALAPHGVFHMHAVAIAVDGRAYVFLAESGVGKSTHARHWLSLLGDRAEIVCDDKPFFSYEKDILLVHGSPWRGREGQGIHGSRPVEAFCILRRATEDRMVRATPLEAMTEFFLRTYMPEDPVGAATVLSLADRTLTTVPFWCLECTDSIHAAEVAYNALSKKE